MKKLVDNILTLTNGWYRVTEKVPGSNADNQELEHVAFIDTSERGAAPVRESGAKRDSIYYNTI